MVSFILALGGVSALTLLWPKLIFALPLFLLAAGATVWQATICAAQASFPSAPSSRLKRAKLFSLTAFLHLIQPVARLYGRSRHGLTAIRRRVPRDLRPPFPKQTVIWSETWRPPEKMLEQISETLAREGAVLLHGGAYDRWDMEVRGGLFSAVRLYMTVEEHGANKQLFRFRRHPTFSVEGIAAILIFTALAVGAALDQCWTAYDILALIALILLARMLYEATGAMAAFDSAIEQGDKK